MCVSSGVARDNRLRALFSAHAVSCSPFQKSARASPRQGRTAPLCNTRRAHAVVCGYIHRARHDETVSHPFSARLFALSPKYLLGICLSRRPITRCQNSRKGQNGTNINARAPSKRPRVVGEQSKDNDRRRRHSGRATLSSVRTDVWLRSRASHCPGVVSLRTCPHSPSAATAPSGLP